MVKYLNLLADVVNHNPSSLHENMMKVVRENGVMLITFINPLSITIMEKNCDYYPMLSSFDYIFSDGILLAMFLSKMTEIEVQRLSFDGNSLAPLVFSDFEKEGSKVAFVGGVEGVATKAAKKITEKYSLDIIYTHSGFFLNNNFDDEIDKIIAMNVKLIVVGMGAPHQECFSIRAKELGFKGVVFTCGGYLDQIIDSGEVYYPYWINRLNLRALYRIFKEPRRLVPRYTIDYWPFYRDCLRLFLKG